MSSKIGRRMAWVARLPTLLVRQCWCSWSVRLVVSLGMLVWLWQQLNLQALQDVMVFPALLPLGGMVGTAWIFVLLGGVKFWVLAKALTPISLPVFLRHFLVATAFGAFTPASLGDFSLAALLRREHVPVQASLAVIIVDRAVTMGMYAIVFVPLTFALLLHVASLWWVPVSVGLSAVLVLVLNGVGMVRQVVRRILQHCPWPFLVDFLATTSMLLRQYPWHLVGNIGLTFLRCLVSGLVVLCALWAAGEYARFFPVLATTNTIAIVNLLPVSLAGLGIYESAGVTLLGQMGLQPERVFVALAYQRLYVLLSSSLILAIASLYVGKRGWLTARLGKPNNDPACASQL